MSNKNNFNVKSNNSNCKGKISKILMNIKQITMMMTITQILSKSKSNQPKTSHPAQ